MISSHTLCLVGEEIVDFAGGAVVCDDGETFVVHVQNQILTLGETFRSAGWGGGRDAHHDGEADKADVTAGLGTGQRGWGAMRGEETYVGADIVWNAAEEEVGGRKMGGVDGLDYTDACWRTGA